ncbi:MAG: outer membrane adhesin-like [Bacteroidetes bacterium]|nr:MAG: outer membrane adhesin-like [Bacteroidota bacterium]
MKRQFLLPLTNRISSRILNSGILALILLTFTLATTAQTTVHIDPTYTGSGQNGSLQTPYSSWSQVSFANGNSYLQKRGTTAYTTSNITITGRNNITVGAYGSGDRPRIIKTTNGGHVLDFTTVSNCIIRDLEISSTAAVTSAIIIDGYGTAISPNNLIDNCVLHGTEWGVRLITQAPGNRILNTTIHNIGDDGIYAKDISTIEIGFCNIYHINTKFFINPDQSYSAGDNIQLVSLYNLDFYIHNNILDHSSTGNKFCFIAAGETYTGVIENNVMIGNSSQTTSCIYLGNTNNMVTIKNNILKDGNYAVYSYASNLQFHYNKVLRNNQGISVMSNRSLTALNNVFYNNNGISIGAGSGTSITSKNNVFHISGSSSRVYNCNSSVVSNFNNFTSQQSNFLNGHSTLSSWQSATGNDANSYVANPQFVNPAADDYCLQPVSPNINVGAAVGLSNDFFGTAVPQASSPDIGIHEVISGGSSNLPPTISNQSFSIAENSANGSVVGQVIASDPDAGQTITYSITSGNTGNAFAINAATGELSVSNQQALDFETNPLFQLTIQVQDNGSGNLTASATITINLVDVNESPVMSNKSFQLNENSPAGAIVGTMTATDPDQGQTISFSITSGNQSGAFSINPTSGLIQVSNSSVIDFELYQSFTLTIVATDNGTPSLSATASVIISIIDLNESPIINDQDFEVESGSPTGYIIGEVEASDPDAGQSLTYSIISGNTSSAFQINPSSGVLSVANSSAVNYLINPQFNLVVRVADNGSPSLNSSANVQVSVSAQINNPPVISAQTFQIPENSANGTQVGQVTASDPNPDQTLTYSITGGNTNGAFSLNAATGIISVANQSALNFETNPQFLLTVQVQDNGEGSLTASATMTINLTDVNESPVITDQNFQVENYATNGTIAGVVVASDPDQGQSLAFAIVSGNTSGAFAVNSATGVLSVANSAAINYLINPEFDLVVSATDNGIPSLSSSTNVYVFIVPSNNDPLINPQSFQVAENSANGTLVGQVVASDPDPGQAITYSIISGNSESAFMINESGQLLVNNGLAINYEVQSTYQLTVMVTDNGEPSLSASARVTVSITDINEVPAIAPDQALTISEHVQSGTQIGIVMASDPDFNQTLTYSITGGNNLNAFSIHPATGMISIAGFVCFEYCSSYELSIRVTDNGSPALSDEKTLSIVITDINETPAIADQSFDIDAYSPVGTTVGTVVATDPDFNQTLTISIEGGNTQGAFVISNSGEITVANPEALNNLTNPSFSLTVRAQDNGSPSLSAYATITISVNSVNSSPVIEAQSFQVAEGSAVGFVIGQIEASDPDQGQQLTYTILTGNTSGAFALSQSGLLTVSNPQALVYNQNPSFTLTVSVSDNGLPVLSAEAQITIDVVTSNNPPVMLPQTYSYNENAPNGRYICTVVATDEPGDTFQFYLLGGNTNDAFKLQAYTGRIFVNNTLALDFETTPVFHLNVRAIDNHGAFSDEIITIQLNDVNEAPVVMNQTFSVIRPANSNTPVGTVIATDPDFGQVLRYFIQQGNTNNIFKIDMMTGLIRINNASAFNKSTATSYNLLIRVRDDGSPALSSYAMITINVVKSKDSDEITIEQIEAKVQTEVAAYPNPSSNGIFTIKCGEFNSSDVVMTASSLTGKTIVQQQVFSSSQTILDLSAMPNGIYIIRILDGENSYMKKLIKQ